MNFSELRFDRLKVLSRIQRDYFQIHTLFDRSYRALCCVQRLSSAYIGLFSAHAGPFSRTHMWKVNVRTRGSTIQDGMFVDYLDFSNIWKRLWKGSYFSCQNIFRRHCDLS